MKRRMKLIQQTLEKLSQMRLHTIADALRDQLQQPSLQELSFEERIAMLVDREWIARENRKLQSRLKAARLKQQASVEDIDFRHPRGLDKSVMLTLSNCNWIRNHQNVIITGQTGIGKSYLGEALAQKACREGFTALYYRVPRLFRDMAIARGDGSYGKLLGKIAKTDLLVVDDWGLSPLNDAERRDFLEIMEDRHGIRSTVITSQYPVAKWHELIGEPTLADAILDRIIHNAHKIILKGESLRKTKAKLTQSDQEK
jgi:DNA replication protein DnaC